MNRITAMIDKVRDNVAKSGKTQDELDKMHKTLDMPFDEYCRFQTMKSAAMGSLLTADEAQTIYGYLGNTPEHFNRQSLEVKYTLTKCFQELLGARIKAKSA